MKKYGANLHVLTKLDDLMWLFNIRGRDIPCNPVALCYGIIMEDKAYVYLQAQSVSLSLKQYFEQQEIMVKDYESFYADVKELEDLSPFVLKEISNFFANYKVLQNVTVEVGEYVNKTQALQIIEQCRAAYIV